MGGGSSRHFCTHGVPCSVEMAEERKKGKREENGGNRNRKKTTMREEGRRKSKEEGREKEKEKKKGKGRKKGEKNVSCIYAQGREKKAITFKAMKNSNLQPFSCISLSSFFILPFSHLFTFSYPSSMSPKVVLASFASCFP